MGSNAGPKALSDAIDKFFLRSGLSTEDRRDCDAYVRQNFPDVEISIAPCQGFCSYTLFVGKMDVVQFRPEDYKLDLHITSAARTVYGCFAPNTVYLGKMPRSALFVYSMGRLTGVSYKDFRVLAASSQTPGEVAPCRQRLVADVAVLLSRSWHRRAHCDAPRGKVGMSLRPRLESLCMHLPSRYRPIAQHVLQHLPSIDSLPWVLTHGDLVSSNIMLDPSTGRLTGLVDWAEAEVLPFGTCLYGLEELLGEMTPQGFVYLEDATRLRRIFWHKLLLMIPELSSVSGLRNVHLARQLGVLLWHGFAWDNGLINRVVQEGRDTEEIRYLEAFLNTSVQNGFLNVGVKL